MSETGFKVYDADQISMVVIGIPIVGGYADDEFCTIEQNEADFVTKVGTDGEVTRSKTNNRSATVKIKLMQSSDSNAALSTISNLDRSVPNGGGVGPLLIRDRQGTTLYTAAKCWIEKAPDATFARAAGPREWTIGVANLVRFDGGN